MSVAGWENVQHGEPKLQKDWNICSDRSLKEQSIAKKLDFLDDVKLACLTILSGDAKIRKLFKNPKDLKLM